jgi:hypothetical protein
VAKRVAFCKKRNEPQRKHSCNDKDGISYIHIDRYIQSKATMGMVAYSMSWYGYGIIAMLYYVMWHGSDRRCHSLQLLLSRARCCCFCFCSVVLSLALSKGLAVLISSPSHGSDQEVVLVKSDFRLCSSSAASSRSSSLSSSQLSFLGPRASWLEDGRGGLVVFVVRDSSVREAESVFADAGLSYRVNFGLCVLSSIDITL